MLYNLCRRQLSVKKLLKTSVGGKYGAGLLDDGIREYNAPSGAANVFDRRSKQHQKNRAATASDAHMYDYLKDKVSVLVFIYLDILGLFKGS